MKYRYLVLGLFVLVTSCKKVEEKKEEIVETPIEVVTENYLIGTYTDSLSQGINLISFTPEKQQLELNQVLDSLPNRSFVIANKAK